MFVPVWLVLSAVIVFVAIAAWSWLLAHGRNPLPFPDGGSRIFAAASPEARAAVVDVLARHGLRERMRVDTDSVQRSILFDGTIINASSPEVMRRVRGATSAIGLVSDDPAARAADAASLLRTRGFSAELVAHVEPGMPIVFLLTDALPGTALNFRPHVLRMPRPGVAQTR
ncbi:MULTISPECIES: hypothetical protein [Luteimonas]|uniref:hypothetical protein n=1 Tax=Luteimonas TaxID=83614 RepID=UPI000C7A2AD5|nr:MULTISPECIES: hypothetical protein [Luteimonas]